MTQLNYGCCEVIAYTPSGLLRIWQFRSLQVYGHDNWCEIGAVDRKFPNLSEAMHYALYYKL